MERWKKGKGKANVVESDPHEEVLSKIQVKNQFLLISVWTLIEPLQFDLLEKQKPLVLPELYMKTECIN